MKRLVILLLLLAAMTTPARAAGDPPPETDIGLPPLPPPSLTATWQGSSLVVIWRWAPPQSCLYLDGVFIPTPCGPSGRAVLPLRGVDTRYVPKGGDQLALAVDTTEGPSVTATVPMVQVILPMVVVH